MEWMKWIGRKVYIRTKSNRVYSGVVTNVYELDSENFILEINDKFNKFVGFSIKEIAEIKEE